MSATVAGLTIGEAIAAVEANLWSMWSAFGRGEGCRLIDEPGMLRFETPLAHTPYNSVMRFRVGDFVDETIDAVLDSYQQRGVPVMWVVHPTAQPADLTERLVARGLVEAEIVPGMVARLDEIPPIDPSPERVEIAPVTPDERDSFLELTAWRYSLPPDAAPTLRSVLETARFGEPGASTQGGWRGSTALWCPRWCFTSMPMSRAFTAWRPSPRRGVSASRARSRFKRCTQPDPRASTSGSCTPRPWRAACTKASDSTPSPISFSTRRPTRCTSSEPAARAQSTTCPCCVRRTPAILLRRPRAHRR